ncbi:OsmC family peroxiredoxin [bacterium]|nr:MAG: OsmC family peroxiredoxin [bacterium]
MSTHSVIQPNAEQIRQSVNAVIGNITTNTDKANAVFTARSELKDGLLAKINIRDFQLIIDEPNSLGGTDLGPNPVEVVLGALGACQEIVVKAYASVLGIEVSSVKVEAQGHLDLRGFFNQADVRPGFKEVKFNTIIETEETDAEKLKSLQFFAENRCPVLDIIQNAVATSGSIAFKKPKVAA